MIELILTFIIVAVLWVVISNDDDHWNGGI